MASITIVKYDPVWRSEFAAVEERLWDELRALALRIDHIGSTAVPRLAAKPIIDVQVSVEFLDPVEPYLEPLQRAGFVWRKDNPERTKRYFREQPGNRRTHIHVRQRGSWHEQFSLLFRDYLRQHERERELYASTKRRLAAQCGKDRNAYMKGKEPVIWNILRRADRWAGHTGWSA